MVGADVLAQVHVPKCAGTSISRWMHATAIAGLTTGFGAFYPDAVMSADDLWEAGLNDRRVTTISAHAIRTFEPHVHGRPMHYFTLLREPREQTVSALRYVVQEREAFGMPYDVPANLPDVAEWLFTRSTNAEYRRNRQTNHIALHPWCAATAGRCDPFTYDTWPAHDRAAYRRERLEIAKEVVAGFLVAGTVERLDETMTLVRDRSAAVGINLLPVAQIQRLNVTRGPIGGSLAWSDQGGVGERLRASIADDEALYAYVGGLLDAQRARAAGGMVSG